MSVDATRWAWSAQGIKANDKLVLLSLADRAGEDHSAWPSYDRLVVDTGLNRKTVDAAVKRLQRAELISDTGRRAGRTRKVKVWQLSVDSDWQRPSETLRAASSKSALNGDHTQSGMIPHSAKNSPLIGGIESPQKRGAEPKTNQPNKEANSEGESLASTKVDKVVVQVPLVGGGAYSVTQTHLDAWQPAYPAVNLVAELHRIVNWLNANPNKRKTRAGINRFLVAWLGRAQDRGGNERGNYGASVTTRTVLAARDVVTDQQVGNYLKAGGAFRELSEGVQQRIIRLFKEQKLPSWVVDKLVSQEVLV